MFRAYAGENPRKSYITPVIEPSHQLHYLNCLKGHYTLFEVLTIHPCHVAIIFLSFHYVLTYEDMVDVDIYKRIIVSRAPCVKQRYHQIVVLCLCLPIFHLKTEASTPITTLIYMHRYNS